MFGYGYVVEVGVVDGLLDFEGKCFVGIECVLVVEFEFFVDVLCCFVEYLLFIGEFEVYGLFFFLWLM